MAGGRQFRLVLPRDLIGQLRPPWMAACSLGRYYLRSIIRQAQLHVVEPLVERLEVGRVDVAVLLDLLVTRRLNAVCTPASLGLYLAPPAEI